MVPAETGRGGARLPQEDPLLLKLCRHIALAHAGRVASLLPLHAQRELSVGQFRINSARDPRPLTPAVLAESEACMCQNPLGTEAAAAEVQTLRAGCRDVSDCVCTRRSLALATMEQKRRNDQHHNPIDWPLLPKSLAPLVHSSEVLLYMTGTAHGPWPTAVAPELA